MVRKGVGVIGRVNRDAVVKRQVGFHETADDLKDSIVSDAILPQVHCHWTVIQNMD